MIDLPDHYDISSKIKSGRKLSALEQFIYDNEPAGTADELKFREGLAAVIMEIENGQEED